MEQLDSLLKRGDFDAVFCGWSFHSGSLETGKWSDVLDIVADTVPGLPVVVLSSISESDEWIQALEAGAFDLLIPPYEERGVLAMLEHAALSREAATRYSTKFAAQA